MSDIVARLYSLTWWFDSVVVPALLMLAGVLVSTLAQHVTRRRLALDIYLVAHGVLWTACTVWLLAFGNSETISWLVISNPHGRSAEVRFLLGITFFPVIIFISVLQLFVIRGVAAPLVATLAYDGLLVASLLSPAPTTTFEVSIGMALLLMSFYLLFWLALESVVFMTRSAFRLSTRWARRAVGALQR